VRVRRCRWFLRWIEHAAAVGAKAPTDRVAGAAATTTALSRALSELERRSSRAHGLRFTVPRQDAGLARGWGREVGRGRKERRRRDGRLSRWRCGRREAARRRRRSSSPFARNQTIPAVLTKPQRLGIVFAAAATPHQQLPYLSSTFAITSNWGRSESEQPNHGYQRAKGSRNSRVSSKPMVCARPKPR
jgi:hypothetical protein